MEIARRNTLWFRSLLGFEAFLCRVDPIWTLQSCCFAHLAYHSTNMPRLFLIFQHFYCFLYLELALSCYSNHVYFFVTSGWIHRLPAFGDSSGCSAVCSGPICRRADIGMFPPESEQSKYSCWLTWLFSVSFPTWENVFLSRESDENESSIRPSVVADNTKDCEWILQHENGKLLYPYVSRPDTFIM